MANKIFREKAIDNVSSPEQLDQHIRVTKVYAWMFLVAILCLLVGVGIWAFTGNISKGIDIKGLVFPTTGVTNLEARSDSTVSDVLVNPGDIVLKNHILTCAPDMDLFNQIVTRAAAGGSSQELDVLRYAYRTNSLTVAKEHGSVQYVPRVGDTVVENQVVATYVPHREASGTREVVTYIPYQLISNIAVGMEAQVSPMQAPREKFGYIKGYISEIGNSIATEEDIKRRLGSEQYAGVLGASGGTQVVEVHIRLDLDDSSVNGYKWANDKGKKVRVTDGNPCGVKIVEEERRPVDMFLR